MLIFLSSGNRRHDRLLLLGLQNGDHVGQGVLGSNLSRRIPVQHNLDANTQDTLAEQDVTDGVVNVVEGRLARVDL